MEDGEPNHSWFEPDLCYIAGLERGFRRQIKQAWCKSISAPKHIPDIHYRS